MKIDELDMFIDRAERGLTSEQDAQWFRTWLATQPGYQMDAWTVLITAIAILSLVVLAVSG